MSRDTGIQWTDATWNPVRGCSKVSSGCANCYAERQAARFSGMGEPYRGLVTRGRWNGKVRVIDEHLSDPLRWTKRDHGYRIFVNSMSDLFHESLPDEAIAVIFGVMAATPYHTYQILTKRPERMRAWFAEVDRAAREFIVTPHAMMVSAAIHAGVARIQKGPKGKFGSYAEVNPDRPWPLPNVHLGVSVEDQETADERIPILLDTPAAVRWVSAEPLLGPVDLTRFMWPTHEAWPSQFRTPDDARAAGATVTRHRQGVVLAGQKFIDWVVVGGESGPSARSCDVAWIRSIVEQCRGARVPAFVKQLGAKITDIDGSLWPEGSSVTKDDFIATRHKKGGDPSEWPYDLRVQRFPT